MGTPKKPQSPAQPEFSGEQPTASHQPEAADNFLAGLKSAEAEKKSSNPFANYHTLPDTAKVITTGANFWDFEGDGALFVGKFLSPVIAVGGDHPGECIGFNTVGPDGVDCICPANYAIDRAVKAALNIALDVEPKPWPTEGWGFCLWISFIGKTQSKKGSFSQFKIATIESF